METPCVACRCVVLRDLQQCVLLTTYGGPPATPPVPLPPPRVTSPDCPTRSYHHRHTGHAKVQGIFISELLSSSPLLNPSVYTFLVHLGAVVDDGTSPGTMSPTLNSTRRRSKKVPDTMPRLLRTVKRGRIRSRNMNGSSNARRRFARETARADHVSWRHALK